MVVFVCFVYLIVVFRVFVGCVAWFITLMIGFVNLFVATCGLFCLFGCL